MANALPLLLAAGAAMLILGGKKGGSGAQGSGGPAPAEPGGLAAQVVGSGQLKNPDTGAVGDYRIIQDANLIWSEIRLPGGAWTQQRSSKTGELIIFQTVESGMLSGPLGLAFKGYTEEVG